MKHIPNAYAEGAPATPSPPPDIYDEVAYAYDGSLEGLLSAVFAAYERYERPTDVAPEERLQPRLGQRVALIPTDQRPGPARHEHPAPPVRRARQPWR
ncbi:MAG: hypothetical protein ACLTDR_07960 [Adlercreutzia equolifaciens]